MKLRQYLLMTSLLVALITACTHPAPDPQIQPDDSYEYTEVGLTAKAKSTVIKLTWKAQPGNPTYRVLRLSADDWSVDPATATYTPLGETKETSFEDKTVGKDKAYYYKIQLLHSTGKVTESEHIACRSLAGPDEYDYALEVYNKLGTATGGKLYELPGSSVLAETIIKIIKQNVGNQPADVVVLLDNTGSMDPYIDDCRTGLNKIIDALPANTRLGAGGYRDRGDLYILRYQDLTTDFATVRSFLARMTASGGGDLREAVYDAVYGVLTQATWKSKKRIIIVVGDYPPQEDPDKTDHSYQEVVDKCRQTGVDVNLFPILINPKGEEKGNDNGNG